jgi:protein TonB
MPRDLFDVVTHPSARTTRTRVTLPVSIALHALGLAAIVAMPLVATDELPDPHVRVVFETPGQLPTPSTPPEMRRPSAPAQYQHEGAAPTEAPSGIVAESGLVRADAVEGTDVGPGAPGLVEGVPGGFSAGGALDPAPPPPPPAPRRIGGDIRPPGKTGHVSPVYPLIAREAHVEGVVILEAIIGPRGFVEDVRVLRSIPLLDQAALDAVRQWTYRPTLLNGVPVPIVMTVTVQFRLQ